MAVRVTFQSSHVERDFSDQQLVVNITRSGADGADLLQHTVHFSVPRDYHVHNDCVAAALLTLVGKSCPQVTFNFPISERCAALLTTCYNLEQVGPIDPAMEPRQPGRHLAINFSGGIDSTALYFLMRDILGDELRVISSDFGERFTRERNGFRHFTRTITCRTDLRQFGFQAYGRFLASVPLLFADYLDLEAIASGHTLHNEGTTFRSIVAGEVPDYRARDAAYHPGGLVEEHIMRGLCSPGAIRIILLHQPERMITALAASAQRRSEKYYTRAVWARHVYAELGIPLPEWLRDLPAPVTHKSALAAQFFTMFTLWAAKYEGMEIARLATPSIDNYDLSFLSDVTMRYTMKYNTNVTHLMRPRLRQQVLQTFHGYGLLPYSESDWNEVATVRPHLMRPVPLH